MNNNGIDSQTQTKKHNSKVEETNFYKLLEAIKIKKYSTEQPFIKSAEAVNLKLIIAFFNPYVEILDDFFISLSSNKKIDVCNAREDIIKFLDVFKNVLNLYDEQPVDLELFKLHYANFNDAIQKTSEDSTLFNNIKIVFNKLNDIILLDSINSKHNFDDKINEINKLKMMSLNYFDSLESEPKTYKEEKNTLIKDIDNLLNEFKELFYSTKQPNAIHHDKEKELENKIYDCIYQLSIISEITESKLENDDLSFKDAAKFYIENVINVTKIVNLEIDIKQEILDLDLSQLKHLLISFSKAIDYTFSKLIEYADLKKEKNKEEFYSFIIDALLMKIKEKKSHAEKMLKELENKQDKKELLKKITISVMTSIIEIELCLSDIQGEIIQFVSLEDKFDLLESEIEASKEIFNNIKK